MTSSSIRHQVSSVKVFISFLCQQTCHARHVCSWLYAADDEHGQGDPGSSESIDTCDYKVLSGMLDLVARKCQDIMVMLNLLCSRLEE